MPNNLLEAITKDLDNFELRNENELKNYTRWLLGEAYMCKQGDTNTNKYAKSMGKDKINKEIRSLVFRGELLLDYNQLLEEVTNFVVNNYENSKKQDDKIQSFNEVMNKTLSYYHEKGKFNANNINEVIGFSKIILSNYFKDNHIRVFSRDKGRDYIIDKSKIAPEKYDINKGKKEILNEMKEELKTNSNDLEVVMNLYANKVASEWLNKINGLGNQKDNLEYQIVDKINKLNLNDRQKEYLANEFQNGNIDSLEGFIPQNLIEEYKKLLDSNPGYSK